MINYKVKGSKSKIMLRLILYNCEILNSILDLIKENEI